MICDGAKRTMRKLAFFKKHKVIRFGDFIMFNLVKVSAEILKIHNSRAFCYLPLQDINGSLPKAVCLL